MLHETKLQPIRKKNTYTEYYNLTAHNEWLAQDIFYNIQCEQDNADFKNKSKKIFSLF